MVPILVLIMTRVAQATLGYAAFKVGKAVVESAIEQARYFNPEYKCRAKEKYYMMICHSCKHTVKSTVPIEMEQPHCPRCGCCEGLEFHETSKKFYDMMTRQSWA